MPIYEYDCPSCGCFEQSQSIHDPPLSRCPQCRRKVQRLISASSFHLKGGGWYSDGYAKKSTASGGSNGESKAADKPAETTSTASDSCAPADGQKPAKPAGGKKKRATSGSSSTTAS